MGTTYHEFGNYGLHQAALDGNDEGVAHAINQGADVNALDNFGRTALMCAVAGERYVLLLHCSYSGSYRPSAR
jgi:ankyrin repeat protein